MTRINIPPAALEAGARAYEMVCRKFEREPLRAAFEAMVKAWPNQHVIDDDVVYILRALILPLTENPDADSK